jgi:hypothetical protein
VAVDDLRVLRLRSFSKGYGLAGCRVGYALGAPEIIATFDKVRNHFGVGRLSQAGALAALEDQAYLGTVREHMRAARLRLGEICAAHSLTALPSATNFVTIDCGRDAAFAKVVLAELLERDVFVRMPGLPPLDRCIRVSCGTDAELVRRTAVIEAPCSRVASDCQRDPPHRASTTAVSGRTSSRGSSRSRSRPPSAARRSSSDGRTDGRTDSLVTRARSNSEPGFEVPGARGRRATLASATARARNSPDVGISLLALSSQSVLTRARYTKRVVLPTNDTILRHRCVPLHNLVSSTGAVSARHGDTPAMEPAGRVDKSVLNVQNARHHSPSEVSCATISLPGTVDLRRGPLSLLGCCGCFVDGDRVVTASVADALDGAENARRARTEGLDHSPIRAGTAEILDGERSLHDLQHTAAGAGAAIAASIVVHDGTMVMMMMMMMRRGGGAVLLFGGWCEQVGRLQLGPESGRQREHGVARDAREDSAVERGCGQLQVGTSCRAPQHEEVHGAGFCDQRMRSVAVAICVWAGRPQKGVGRGGVLNGQKGRTAVGGGGEPQILRTPLRTRLALCQDRASVVATAFGRAGPSLVRARVLGRGEELDWREARGEVRADGAGNHVEQRLLRRTQAELVLRGDERGTQVECVPTPLRDPPPAGLDLHKSLDAAGLR